VRGRATSLSPALFELLARSILENRRGRFRNVLFDDRRFNENLATGAPNRTPTPPPTLDIAFHCDEHTDHARATPRALLRMRNDQQRHEQRDQNECRSPSPTLSAPTFSKGASERTRHDHQLTFMRSRAMQNRLETLRRRREIARAAADLFRGAGRQLTPPSPSQPVESGTSLASRASSTNVSVSRFHDKCCRRRHRRRACPIPIEYQTNTPPSDRRQGLRMTHIAHVKHPHRLINVTV